MQIKKQTTETRKIPIVVKKRMFCAEPKEPCLLLPCSINRQLKKYLNGIKVWYTFLINKQTVVFYYFFIKNFPLAIS
ncbi:MAG: hypothetical protein DI598_12505 [Pseudopedobacter saltans]|uniref:Uncharacterized protein n=1 Tax=Pseudopedobacter saltans TaxID=151895 RepID=A0A2W5GS49_9SPHI|nr:MAG: hypothetical protein DI598_12505 [Pseudopedobacter saltans]